LYIRQPYEVAFLGEKMRRFAFWALVCASAFSFGQTGPTIEVSASFAPNVFGSPSWADYRDNAIVAIRDGLNGNGGFGPSQYANIETQTFSVDRNIVTNFSSWNGVAGPSAPFDGEFGNRLHFGLRILRGSAQISLSQLHFDFDGGAYGALDYSGDFVGLDYSANRVGILFGGDNAFGGGDDTYVTAGSGTTLVDGLAYVGVGNATEALSGDPGATNQEKIDLIALQIPDHTVNMTYWLQGAAGGRLGEGSTYVNFQAVPEPGTVAALGLGAIALLRKRRKK
jgi:hypothetical protein